MPICELLRPSPDLCVNSPESAPASVTSRPSSIQVMPSATMTRMWKRPTGRASRRAGMSVSTTVPVRLGGAMAPVGGGQQIRMGRCLACLNHSDCHPPTHGIPVANALCAQVFRELNGPDRDNTETAGHGKGGCPIAGARRAPAYFAACPWRTGAQNVLLMSVMPTDTETVSLPRRTLSAMGWPTPIFSI